MDPTTLVLIVGVALLLTAVGVGVRTARRRRGPDRGQSPQVVAQQQALFAVRRLDPAVRRRYAEAWRKTQHSFFDAPGEAIAAASQLAEQVMRERGYPVEDFEELAGQIAVENPHVVRDYERACRAAAAYQAGAGDVRQVLVAYRSLFDRLLDDADDPGDDDDPLATLGTVR